MVDQDNHLLKEQVLRADRTALENGGNMINVCFEPRSEVRERVKLFQRRLNIAAGPPNPDLASRFFIK
jgi:hypothetical protein